MAKQTNSFFIYLSINVGAARLWLRRSLVAARLLGLLSERVWYPPGGQTTGSTQVYIDLSIYIYLYLSIHLYIYLSRLSLSWLLEHYCKIYADKQYQLADWRIRYNDNWWFHGSMFDWKIDWLIDWWIDWLIDWSIDGLIDLLIDRLMEWFLVFLNWFIWFIDF